MKKTLAWLLLVCPALFAQERRPPGNPDIASPAPAPSEKSERATPPKEQPRDQISTTQHSVTVNGQVISYTARAGTMVLKDEEGAPRANFFFVSYTRDGADAARRPVTFTFNGGPGSSSVWLHMGAFGPKRVSYSDDEGHAALPPYRLVDNDNTLLDVTDLVFIDPVTTGFSRAIPFKDASKFHGVDADVESVGEFIRLWMTRYGRWSSPKFLAGESYGTTRAAGLSGWLQQQGVYPNGIVLISSILNFETASFDSGNDLAYQLFLPTYTAIAWYHKRLPADLQNGTADSAARDAQAYPLGPASLSLMQVASIS